MKTKTKEKLKKVWNLIKTSGMEFMDDNCLKLSASLSYSTIFSLPALAILIISSVGLFLDEKTVSTEFLSSLSQMLGPKVASQVETAVDNINVGGKSMIGQWVGIFALIFSGSAIFAEIQSSINYIWELKPKPQKGILRIIINRLLSFAMIGALGFILLVSLLINTMLDVLSDQLSMFISPDNLYLATILNTVIVFVIVTLIFGFIFKTLPDGKLGWKETLVGSILTATLFIIGKTVISNYLVNTSKIEIYGAAGSVLLILVWVYYSAIILYFGAVFTKNYSEFYGSPIEPSEYSVRVIIEEKEVNYAKTKEEVQQKHQKRASKS